MPKTYMHLVIRAHDYKGGHIDYWDKHFRHAPAPSAFRFTVASYLFYRNQMGAYKQFLTKFKRVGSLLEK